MHRKDRDFIWRHSVVAAAEQQPSRGDRPYRHHPPVLKRSIIVGAGGKGKSLKERGGHVACLPLLPSPFSRARPPMAAAAAAQKQQAASVLQSFPFRAAVLALCVLLLPLLPPAQQQAPEAAAGGGGAGQAFVAKAWELLHLLVVGIAVSYGLFSRKNSAADDGRAHDEKADARYVSRMFRDSLAPFDDDHDVDTLPGTPGGREDGGGGGKARSWSAMHRPDEPVVVVTNGGGGRASETLSLPVRTLKPQPASAGRDETVLPSPIPWRSRSGRFDAARPASPRSPKRLSPASSSARETLAKASEEYYTTKRRSPHRSSSSSSTISSTPPAPPPPPPPFLVHGYHPAAERRTAKSFKEELQDHSIRGRERDEQHYSPNASSFDVSAYSTTTNSSPLAKARSSVDTGSSSSSASIGKSVRTFRAREAPVFPGQTQESPEEDAGDGREELGVHDAEEPYGYRAYQSIPRFQYERSVSDPILGRVAVSSDETESSDDDDDGGGGGGGGADSTRESTPEVDENEVDKKAEEFIARFREQIRRQRIESIKRSAGPRGVKHGK